MAPNQQIFETGPRALKLGLTFRPMKPKDLAFLQQVYSSTRQDEVSQTGWNASQIDNFLQMQFQAQHSHYQKHYPDAHWLIVLARRKAIGRLYLEEWPSEIRLIDIALLPEARNGGNGSAILQDLMDLAKDRSKSLGIHVEKSNPAMELYQRLGFSKTEDKGVYDLLHWHP